MPSSERKRPPRSSAARAAEPGAAATRVPSPAALVAESRTRLASRADPRVAAQARSYFKEGEEVACYGLTARSLREVERELSLRVARQWTLQDAVAYCDGMLALPQLEAKGLGLLLLARRQRAFTPELLRTAKAWLARGRCASWATTDTLAQLILAPLLARWPERTRVVAAWARSRNLWLRRASAVALVPLARRGAELDAAYRVAAALRRDSEDLVHKATGWLLREAGKTDPARLERFLLARGRQLSRTALRYAIERFPPARRRRLLEATGRRARRPRAQDAGQPSSTRVVRSARTS
jgi:3-methyladenine DNA glycosylase AlkD